MEPRSASKRSKVPSLVTTAPVSASVLSEEAATFRVLPLETDRVRDNMTFPCQLTVKLAEPSHSRASASVFASVVFVTTISFTVEGHGDERKSGSGSSSSSSSS